MIRYFWTGCNEMAISDEETDPSRGSLQLKKHALNSIFFVVSFWSLNQIAYLFTVTEGISLFYPPSGFAMLLIYLFGARYIPIYFIAIIIGGLPQRDVWNYSLEMLNPDLRQLIIYSAAGLFLRKLNPKKQVINANFFYSLIITCVATAFLSSIIFVVGSSDFNSLISGKWPDSVSLLFVGNLTGALAALPIFMFYLHARAIGWDALKSDLKDNIFRPEKAIALFVIIFLSFLVISLGKIDDSFSNYYYFVLIPIIWTSVKWGLGLGLMYAFIGNVFTLAMYVFFEVSHYGVLEVQVMFAMSIIATILIGLVHEQKDRFYEQSMYDGLTGLANMRLFKDISDSMIASANRNSKENAFLFVDVDGFKTINDTFGHKAGDDFLRYISELLRNSVRGSDCVARFGGDEFVIQLEGNTSEKGAETVALNIIKNMSNPFYFESGVATVGASIGIAMYPRDGTDTDTLIRKADQAMYAAKESGKNCYRLYGSL